MGLNELLSPGEGGRKGTRNQFPGLGSQAVVGSVGPPEHSPTFEKANCVGVIFNQTLCPLTGS